MTPEDALGRLFDVPVAVCVASADTGLDPLCPSERTQVAPSWAPKRLWDYQAGRHCARRALQRLGTRSEHLESGLVNDARGVPNWPEGVAGSITHTGRGPTRFAACVVTRNLKSLGIDAEIHVPLRPELQKRVLTPVEQELAGSSLGTAAEIAAHALLVFSAKESFYKCQFACSGTTIGFHEVETRFDLSAGRFEASCSRDLGSIQRGQPLYGRFTTLRGMVLTAVSLP